MNPAGRTKASVGRMAERSAQKAFTLLEVVCVLVIIAVIAAIASPRYATALTNYRADGIARRIVADLDQARLTAQSTSASVTVIFDVPGNRYDIPLVPSLNDPGVGVAVDLSVEPYRARLVSASIGGDGEVIFNGYGIPDSGGTIAVACGSSTRVVVLDQETGLGTVQ